jgi:predicted permease
MASVFASLIPVFLIIATGWICRATGFVDDKQWIGLERITYVIFFPALIIHTLAQADLASVPILGVGGAMSGSILLIAALLLLARRALQSRLNLDGPSFTSLFQGSTRWNTFVALAIVGSLFGPRGVALMAVAIAAMVPLLNVLALFVLVRYAGGPRQTVRQILRTFASNPFIWSCAVGLLLNQLIPPLPKPLIAYFNIIGSASLSAGLLIVGAGLNIKSIARPRPAHLLSIGLKLLLLPVTAVTLARLLGVEGADRAVALIAGSVPTSSAAYVLARQLGGDAPLMAEIVTVQTVFAMVTMPLMMALLAS